MEVLTQPLYLPAGDFRFLFDMFGPSLGFWRAAEVAAMREMTRQVPCEPPVLDLGGGDGLVISRILPRLEIGVDPDEHALALAAARGIYARTIPRTMEEADLPPGCVGTILSNSVLEHVQRIDDALAAVSRALRPGGRMIFTSPTEAFSRSLALPLPTYAARRNRHFIHLNLWPLETWSRRLEQHGLRIECVRPYLRRRWVWNWDVLDLLESIHLGKGPKRVRVLGRLWKKLPSTWVDALARRAARLDLAAPPPGGGRLIVAQKM